MQKNIIPAISTGRFAKLCGTSKRTLVHYDEIGLFRPAMTDQRGYRYYTEAQCDVFAIITALKEIGMPLQEIQSYLDNRSPAALKTLLQAQRKLVQQELENLRRIDQMIATKLQLLEQGEQVVCNTVSVEQCPQEYLILSEPVNSDAHDKIIERLYQHLDYCFKNRFNVGHPFGAMMHKNSLLNGQYKTYAYFFTKVTAPQQTPCLFIKPAGLYAVTYMEGNYYEADEAFRALLAFIAHNSYEICGYSYKEGIIDEISQKDMRHYITRISIQIKPADPMP